MHIHTFHTQDRIF